MTHTEEVVIEAGHSAKNYWKDLWKNRELLWILSKRDLSVRYKQSMIGVGWALIRPLFTMVVMVFVFSKVAKLPGDPGIPYPLTILAGITVWSLFSTTFQQVSHSILFNANLVTKVYFPRLLMPLSSIVVGFVDFLVAVVLYISIAFWYGHTPGWQAIFLPFFLLLTLLASLSFGLFFAVINVRYRDIAQLIPFLIQIGFYICPIAYSSRLVENSHEVWWYDFYYLNPLVGIIDGFRWCLLGDNSFFIMSSLYSSISIIAFFIFVSYFYFRSRENSFVDYI
jgi:lipopolysaccharide transport system permease protein